MENGLGQGDPFAAVVQPVADRIFNALLPRMKDIVARASEAAEPTIRKVIKEEVVPAIGLITILGLVAGAVAASAIGSYFATKRNPAYLPIRRRRAA